MGTIMATGVRPGCVPLWSESTFGQKTGGAGVTLECSGGGENLCWMCRKSYRWSTCSWGSYKARQLDRGEGPSCPVGRAEVWLSVSRSWAAAARLRRLLLEGLAKGSIAEATGFGSTPVGKVEAGLCENRVLEPSMPLERHAKSAGGTVGGQGLSGAGTWLRWRQPYRARSTPLTSRQPKSIQKLGASSRELG